MTRYVKVTMLAKHTGKHPASIRRAMMRVTGAKAERFPRVDGLRIPEKDANAFLAKYWPESGPMPPTPLK